MSQSLRLRLLLGAVMAIALVLLLVGLGLSRVFSSYASDRYRADLFAVMDQLAANIDLTGNEPTIGTEPSDPRFELPGGGLYWQVVGEAGLVIRSRSLWDVALDTKALKYGLYGFREAVGPDGAIISVEQRRIEVETPEGLRPFTILAAFDRQVIDNAISDYHESLTIMLAMTAGVLFAAAFMQIGIGLAPLSRLQAQVALVRSGLSDEVQGDGPTELTPLVRELNQLLAERETAIERARARASDLAHGLKTPLTVLLQLAENLPERERSLIRQQVDLIRQRADRQLQSARLGVEQMAQTGLASLTGKLVSVLLPVTAARDIAWNVNIDEHLTADMDPADLAEALGNVLDNASRFARTVIVVSARRHEQSIRVDVEDDGPGVAEGDLKQIVGRGVHLESDHGTGLGLAITADVLAAYGGSISFAASELGGLQVSLLLPASR